MRKEVPDLRPVRKRGRPRPLTDADAREIAARLYRIAEEWAGKRKRKEHRWKT